MALDSKTKKADRLERGPTASKSQETVDAEVKRLLAAAAKLREDLNLRLGPVTQAEWAEACGDTE
ncbi:MAG TPA: hypothetical protein VG889_04975 [Rhizomicrobium sp.]|nr:hypothetical protein [Rhizomicrobium sp.]